MLIKKKQTFGFKFINKLFEIVDLRKKLKKVE